MSSFVQGNDSASAEGERIESVAREIGDFPGFPGFRDPGEHRSLCFILCKFYGKRKSRWTPQSGSPLRWWQ